jgi:DNA-binding NtrC family response regulator
MLTTNPFMNMRGVGGRIAAYVGACLAAGSLVLIFSLGPHKWAVFYLVLVATVGLLAVVGAAHTSYLGLNINYLFLDRAFSKMARLEEFVQDLVVIGEGRENLEGRLEIMLQGLYRTFQFERGFIVARTADRRTCIRFVGPPPTRAAPAHLVDPLASIVNFRMDETFPKDLEQARFLESEYDWPRTLAGARPNIRHPRLEGMLRQFLESVRPAGYVLYLPLMSRGHLVAVAFLGPRSGNQPYYIGELRMLEAVASRWALSLLNAYRTEVPATRTRDRGDTSRSSDLERFERQEIKLGQGRLVFVSPRMQQLVEKTRRIATSPLPVLIQGETGTGKELIARLLHATVDDRKPFMAVNCAAIPESLWESEVFGVKRGAFTGADRDRPGYVARAADGVLFFDEIGEMPVSVQPRILRLIQERTYEALGATKTSQAECRLVFASHRDLVELIGQGRFRQDLYYRINVHRIEIPPLRQRPEDILPIAASILSSQGLDEALLEERLEAETLERLTRYSWPGNVRELENAILSAMVTVDGRIRASDIGLESGQTLASATMRGASVSPGRVASGAPSLTTNGSILPAGSISDLEGCVRAYRTQLIMLALAQNEGNRSKTARVLGISRGKLLYQMRELGIDQNP